MIAPGAEAADGWASGTVTAAIDPRGVVTATMNRPAARNALDPATIARLIELFDLCSADPAVRILCLTGAGGHFCAGADLKAGADANAAHGPPRLMAAVARLTVPLVALVRGGCVGLGAAIAARSDIVIASPDAYFALPEVRIGLPPSLILPYLAEAIGVRQASRYALTGERLPAERAHALGLVDLIAEPAAMAEAAEPLIDALMHGAPGVIAATKAIVDDIRNRRFEHREHAPAALAGEDFAEGRAAFAARRPPRWYRPREQTDDPLPSYRPS